MANWNKAYTSYIEFRKLQGYSVKGVPTSLLFVESCNRSKHNIIYLKSQNLSTTGPAAYYKFVHRWDFWTFYSNIVFNNQWLWTSDRRIEFINIMIHELGHALGIPHKKTKESVQEPTFYPAHQCHEASSTIYCNPGRRSIEIFLSNYKPTWSFPVLAE